MSDGLVSPMHKCVVSGSFRKYYAQIASAVRVFRKHGIDVLSPQVSRIVNPGEEFAILESDLHDLKAPVIRHIEGKVLERIRLCDFLYVCNPKGYIGLSTVMEIGYALACGKHIVVLEEPSDGTLLEFVHDTATPTEFCHQAFTFAPSVS